MAKGSLVEITSAEALASTDADHAFPAFERARALFTWGFPVDALGEFSRARALAPGRADIATAAERIERVVANGGSEPR